MQKLTSTSCRGLNCGLGVRAPLCITGERVGEPSGSSTRTIRPPQRCLPPRPWQTYACSRLLLKLQAALLPYTPELTLFFYFPNFAPSVSWAQNTTHSFTPLSSQVSATLSQEAGIPVCGLGNPPVLP